MKSGFVVSMMIAMLAAGKASAQPVPPSAYAGTVGDWALGKWSGHLYANLSGVGLQTLPRILSIEKKDGWVGCKFSAAEWSDRVPWSPKCTIDANGISMTTAWNAWVELKRVGTDKLEGRTKSAAGVSNTAFFSR